MKVNEKTLRKIIRESLEAYLNEYNYTKLPGKNLDQKDLNYVSNSTWEDSENYYSVEDRRKDTIKDWKAAVKRNPDLMKQAKSAVKNGECGSIEDYIFNIWADKNLWQDGTEGYDQDTNFGKKRRQAEINAAWDAYDSAHRSYEPEYDPEDVYDSERYYNDANMNVYNSNDFDDETNILKPYSLYNFQKAAYFNGEDLEERVIKEAIKKSIRKVLKNKR